MLKQFSLSAACVLGSICISQAADDIAFDESRFDWSGTYIGVGVGHADFSITDLTFGGGDPEPSGVTVTGFVGHNWQSDNFVFGVEGDATVGDVDGSNGSTGGFMQPAELEYMASIRGRAGIVHESLMFFATAGWGVAEFSFEHDAVPSPGSNVDVTFSGFTYGGGVEWAIGDDTFVRADITWFDFGNEVAPFFGGTDNHAVSVDDGYVAKISIAKKLN